MNEIESPPLPKEIKLKPGIDHIPDEFPRESNENILVEIVRGEEDMEAESFEDYLKKQGYLVSKTDKNRQKITEPWLNNVLKKLDDNDYDGLIMIFAKVAYSNDIMKYIWGKFTVGMCPKLKNKPKIFMFQIHGRSSVPDATGTILNWPAQYETPAEADILIIYDMFDTDRHNLLKQLQTYIDYCGDKEEIITLTSLSNNSFNYQPLIISTMTRKFYFKVHEHRGHHYDLHTKTDTIKQTLESLEKKPRSKGTKTSLFSNFTRKISFRKNRNSEKNKSEVDGRISKNIAKTPINEEVTGPSVNEPAREVNSKANKSDTKSKIDDKKTGITPSTARSSIRKKSDSSSISSNANKQNSKGDIKQKAPWKP